MTEANDGALTIEFQGETFRLRGKVGLMPMMRFARAARSGLATADLEGLAAMYDLLRSCIHPEDWAAFEVLADDSAADEDALLEVVRQTYETLAERPTARRASSSVGAPTISGSSGESSSDRAIARQVSAGRPDLALVHIQAQEARAV